MSLYHTDFDGGGHCDGSNANVADRRRASNGQIAAGGRFILPVEEFEPNLSDGGIEPRCAALHALPRVITYV